MIFIICVCSFGKEILKNQKLLLFIPSESIIKIQTHSKMPMSNQYIKNGEAYISTFEDMSFDAKKVFGITYFLKNDEDVLNCLLNNIKVYNQEKIEDKIIVTGFSNFGVDYVMLAGKKINIQMAICEKQIIIGLPLILGAY